MLELAATYGRVNQESRARVTLVVALTASLTACQVVYPMPRAPDPDTNKYECPDVRPIGFSVLAVVAAMSAVAVSKAGKPTTCAAVDFWNGTSCVPRTDMYGYPNCGFPLAPDCNSASPDYRKDMWPLIGLASLATIAAVASWSQYAHCTRLDSNDAPKPVEAPKDQRHDELAAMARTAMSRMDAGDCDTVRSIAVRVRALDPVYYADVFLPVFGACISR